MRFRKMFYKIDSENNGFVTFENIKEFFDGYFPDENSLLRFFEALDIDGNGKIHWNEFLSSIIS
jgi:Ca2+-binding EF-hand superfamily protein